MADAGHSSGGGDAAAVFNWQRKGWPVARVDKAALRDELDAFGAALRDARRFLAKPQNPEAVALALAREAVTTSAIEGVNVDESVVMSSICKVLGVAYAPKGFAKDARAEGVARMMLAVRKDWDKTLSAPMLKRWHGELLRGGDGRISAGDFRRHEEPMRVIRRHADGTAEIRFEAPPSNRVPAETARFVEMWKAPAAKPSDTAIKCAMMHPHFESIHPFEDGNGRVGRALVAKTLAEGLGQPLVLPVSTVIARHRAAYYDEIHAASRSLDWTDWAAFFIPVLAESIRDFTAAVEFISAKKAYLDKYGPLVSDRAKKTILRMFEDGREGIQAGLSAAKWVRMSKVSKRTAERDLAELSATGAIIPVNDGPQTRYRLDVPSLNGAIDTINDTINIAAGDEAGDMGAAEKRLLKLIMLHPGRGVPFFKAALSVSRATAARAVAALAKAGRVERRGSKKTGGYYAK